MGNCIVYKKKAVEPPTARYSLHFNAKIASLRRSFLTLNSIQIAQARCQSVEFWREIICTIFKDSSTSKIALDSITVSVKKTSKTDFSGEVIWSSLPCLEHFLNAELCFNTYHNIYVLHGLNWRAVFLLESVKEVSQLTE
jgi:hypothetical protein